MRIACARAGESALSRSRAGREGSAGVGSHGQRFLDRGFLLGRISIAASPVSRKQSTFVRHRVEIAFEGGGGAWVSAVSRFAFAVSEQDQEDLRWYLEDYLQYPDAEELP